MNTGVSDLKRVIELGKHLWLDEYVNQAQLIERMWPSGARQPTKELPSFEIEAIRPKRNQ